MSPDGIIKLEREGAGLSKMDLDPEAFQSPLPEQYIDIVFQDPALEHLS